jgi:hypothetical protein
MFFGYVETTQLELAIMMAFTGALAAMLNAQDERIRWRWEYATWVCFSAAVLAHGGGCVLFPACFVLAATDPGTSSLNFPGPGNSLFRFSRNFRSVRRLGAIFLIVIVPYFSLMVEPFFLHGDFGNMNGGADGIMLVPFRYDYLHPVSPLVSYSMISLWHLADICSAIFIAAPLAFPLLLAVSWSFWKTRPSVTMVEKRFLLILGLAAGSALSIPLLWNHDWGMWGDWNIAATYLFPLNCFAWVAFMVVHRSNGFSRRDLLGLLLPLLLVQSFSALGILLQLY